MMEGHGSSGREPALDTQGLGFSPWHCQEGQGKSSVCLKPWRLVAS